jgi:hypothetical protein
MGKILEVKDRENSYKIKKPYFDLPMRGVIVGKSQFSGKTNAIANLLMRPFDAEDYEGKDFYRNDFEPENIYIVSPSIATDQKLNRIVDFLEIPYGNLMDHYDEVALEKLYDYLEEDYKRSIREEKKPTHKLIILDDCAYTGDLKRKAYGALSKLFCNGRHIMCSTIVTAQKWTQVMPTARENCTFAIIFSCTDHQLKTVTEDCSILPRPIDFKRLFRQVTNEPYSFMVVNYKNRVGEGRYMDQNFEPVDEHITSYGEIETEEKHL